MSDLPLSVRRISAASDALGFTLHTVTPEHVIAYRVDLKAGFEARWKKTDKSTVFQSAIIHDPIGNPVELYFEYKVPSMRSGKNETESSFQTRVRQAEDDAARQNAEYNDGAQWIEHEWLVSSTTPLHHFLNEWMGVLGVDAKPLPIPKPRQKKVEKIADEMLAGEEWTSV